MKKGYKECPFCKNEIKKDAIKCQYCEEFLDGRTEEKVEKTDKNSGENIKKGFSYKFFRKDLELNKKRGHRLLKIIFWLLIFVLLVRSLIIEIKSPDRIYEVVEPLKNRFTSDLVNLPDLLNKGEIVYYDHTYGAPLFYVWWIGEDKYSNISDDDLERFNNVYGGLEKDLSAYYCSTQLANNFSKLKKITGMSDVRAYEGANDVVRWDIDNDINNIKRYINNNDIKQYTKVDEINCIAAKNILHLNV